jgi:hypothetical protein
LIFVALLVVRSASARRPRFFSVVDAVVRRGLPLDEYDRLAAVLEYDPRRPVTFGGGATPQLFPDWRQQQQSFDGLAAVGSTT